MNQHKSRNSIDILLVEDNPGDVRLTIESLKEAKLLNKLHISSDGEEAMAFLRREREFKDAPRPDLILLDLNLPRKDGREVLAEIKEDSDLKQIPVVILTTSNSCEDIQETYNSYANCYIKKPVVLDEFIKVVMSIENFWLCIVQLPPKVFR
ncbi:response regulator [Candidatus Borrarchaeum sp.]|uniref:response regulator n=1 Tax=Candidatus Borrarchaeum sp. TaxID=2846742 RepID=UPI00257E720C|nr:response regulator [Candidatus Borrarchaeum sp.]